MNLDAMLLQYKHNFSTSAMGECVDRAVSQVYIQVFLYSCASHAACSLLPLRWGMDSNRHSITTHLP